MEKRRQRERISQQSDDLLDFLLQIVLATDIRAAGRRIISFIGSRLDSHGVSLWVPDPERVLDPEQGERLICVARHPSIAEQGMKTYDIHQLRRTRKKLTEWVFARCRPLSLDNIHDTAERDRKARDAKWTHSESDTRKDEKRPVLWVPIKSFTEPTRAVGVIRIDSNRTRSNFSPAQQRFVEVCAVAISFALGYISLRAHFPLADFEPLFEELKSPRKKQVTVLFIDLTGFTYFSNRVLGNDPEQIVSCLNSFFNWAVPVIYKYNGTIDKFLGDGLLALFNAHSTCERHALSAAECALEIRRRFLEFRNNFLRSARVQFGRVISEEKFTLSLRIGISTGDVVVGTVGATGFKEGGGVRHRRADITVIGQDVNFGARLIGDVAKQTKELQPDSRGVLILASHKTWQKIKHRIRGERFTAVIRGAGPEGEEPWDVYKLLGKTYPSR